MKTRRSAVFIIPNSFVGHELVFRHHTNKVVVGNYILPMRTTITEQPKKNIDRKNKRDY